MISWPLVRASSAAARTDAPKITIAGAIAIVGSNRSEFGGDGDEVKANDYAGGG